MFINSSIMKNDPVNMDLCATFTKAKGNNEDLGKYYIVFSMSNGKAITWVYDSKDERDSAYLLIRSRMDEVVI